MTTIIMILFIITVLLLGVKLRHTHTQKRRNYPPGPFSWPLIGNLFYVRKLTKELGAQYLAFDYLSKKYKSNVINLQLGANVVVINDSKLMHNLMQKDEFNARPWNTMSKLRNMGMKKGLTMNVGSEHKELRAWSLRTMRHIGYGQRTMNDFLLNQLQIILDKLKEGNVRCMKPVIAPATINTLWLLIAGKQIFDSDKRLQSFLHLMECRAKVFDMSGGIMSSFPWLCYIAPNMTGYNILLELNEKLRDLLMDFINKHKERYQYGSETDFIDWFLREMSEHGGDKNDSVFEDNNLLLILVDFFIAGIGTTTPALEFLFLEMANHQDAQLKLHEEIDRVIGPDRFPDTTDRSKMNYTEAVITECIRKWMIIPVISRETMVDTTIENYKVPRGTTVLFNIASNNRNALLFPDPMSFKPERFLRDGIFQIDDNLLPFGKGKRRCPGEILARSALFFFFIGVMQKYRVLPPNNQDFIKIEVNAGLTINPKPYKILIVPR
ncbi:probable cytochrome P450 305a1 [Pseudomyrmex gracilis]|uniref:probable cytochrome P450 305a1 n=1 Tax=Pseudomyrmex gracilis TaxID=219809 RepID=UPI0009958760|nr:probable cytochrome P450 305a1 [Pseudomyrmex gracilis]XP_020293832.1 probable cytochrome P450 305a1 [Pseudomyrmex gracilis]